MFEFDWPIWLGLILCGLFIGSLAPLFGIGGGVFVVLFLMIFFGVDSGLVATATGLGCVLFTSTTGALSYIIHRKIDFPLWSIFVLFSVPGSIAGGFLGTALGQEKGVLRLIFAIVIISLGVWQLTMRFRRVFLDRKKKRQAAREAAAAAVPQEMQPSPLAVEDLSATEPARVDGGEDGAAAPPEALDGDKADPTSPGVEQTSPVLTDDSAAPEATSAPEDSTVEKRDDEGAPPTSSAECFVEGANAKPDEAGAAGEAEGDPSTTTATSAAPAAPKRKPGRWWGCWRKAYPCCMGRTDDGEEDEHEAATPEEITEQGGPIHRGYPVGTRFKLFSLLSLKWPRVITDRLGVTYRFTARFFPFAYLGLFGGMLGSALGLGGGVIYVPILLAMGVPPPIATATSTMTIFTSNIFGIIVRHENILWDYAILMGGASMLPAILIPLFVSNKVKSVVLEIGFWVISLAIALYTLIRTILVDYCGVTF
eukprot:gnl/Trimastix_PCT/1154.p1 GENE.gnl/Trimastix_PCT/1154~~gnl/Trimastix_PCT/1154.p1  ORF type:complete len:481 (+),score=163.43 gnl/Trimastix_PCT/1154:561-2003(+)